MNVNIETFLAVLGTTLGGVALVYIFLQNFKEDINNHIDRLESRMNRMDIRADKFENRMSLMDERMFMVLTGKQLKDAILEEKLKKNDC
jgi:hypothetical protein